jgi:5-methylcytosine-specific restriction endonuclease McrA
MFDRKTYDRIYNKQRYRDFRDELLNLLGGKCCQCGSTAGLHFDHKDPLAKCFAIGELLSHARQRVLDEVKKCQLLCESCHIDKSRADGSFRRNKAKGEQIHQAKLSQEQVSEIRRLRCEGVSRKELAKMFGVGRGNIYQIEMRKTWKHVP